MVALLVALVSSCSDDFLSASSTEKQESGAPAYEGAILANLAQLIRSCCSTVMRIRIITVFRSCRISVPTIYSRVEAMRVTNVNCICVAYSHSQEQPEGLWSILYSGIARANNAISACENAVEVPEEKVNSIRPKPISACILYPLALEVLGQRSLFRRTFDHRPI